MQTCTHAITTEAVPWVPLKPGLAMRPLRFEQDGYALQLRLEPGTVIPLHRHIDSWMCHGDEDCIIQISLTGRVEYLAEDGSVQSYSDSGTARAAYLEHCERAALTPDPRILGRTLPAPQVVHAAAQSAEPATREAPVVAPSSDGSCR